MVSKSQHKRIATQRRPPAKLNGAGPSHAGVPLPDAATNTTAPPTKLPNVPVPPPGPPSLLDAVKAMHEDLRAAVARKPNEALTRVAYQLKALRVEMASLNETLEKQTSLLARVLAAPTLAPAKLCESSCPYLAGVVCTEVAGHAGSHMNLERGMGWVRT